MASKALTERRKPQDNVATSRYERWMGGETAEAIAETDGVSLALVDTSIRHGSRIESMKNAEQLMRLKERAAVENERIRKDVRAHVAGAMKEAVATLLKGKRIMVMKDETGKVSFEEYDDPDVLVAGLEQARKTISFDEKPGPSVLINSISQTVNNGAGSGGGEAWDFEGELDRIRAGPSDELEVDASAPSEPFIEAETVPSAPVDAAAQDPLLKF